MTVLLDASSPVPFDLSSNVLVESGTSASFTPPNGSLLRVSATCVSVGTPTFNLPSNTGTGVGVWRLVKSQVNVGGGSAAIWEAQVSTGSATTVTVSISNTGNPITTTIDAQAWVDVWTGAATDQSTAATDGANSSTQNFSPTITTTVAGAQVHGVGMEFNDTGTPTSSDTFSAYRKAGQSAGGRAYKAANSGAPGSVALNFNAGGASPQWVVALAEILPASGGGPTFVLMGQACL